MSFVKVIKNKAYFKRYQTKFRRRREGKTDFRRRKRMITQVKDKYQTPRYRFVVRISNTRVTTQIVFSTMKGDRVMAQATSAELPRYGLTVGLKNYAAAYCTGLLLARRLLQKIGLEDNYEGNDADGIVYKREVAGKVLYVEDLDWESEKRPFRAFLDIGLAASTTGARIFGALKGAADGGLDIPHSFKRFPGVHKNPDTGRLKYNPAEHRGKIFGENVADYMRSLQLNDEKAYRRQFSKYIEAGVEADDLEELYAEVHERIRDDPSPASEGHKFTGERRPKRKKRSLSQRKDRVQQKINSHLYRMALLEEEE